MFGRHKITMVVALIPIWLYVESFLLFGFPRFQRDGRCCAGLADVYDSFKLQKNCE